MATQRADDSDNSDDLGHLSPNIADDNFSEVIDKNFNSDDIARREMSAAEGATGDVTGTRSDEIEKFSLKNSQADGEDFYKEVKDGGPSALRGGAFVKRNRGKLMATIAAITLIGGGGAGIFGLLAGPLQFVQIAKMLQRFHYSNQEDVSDDQFMKIARYVRFQGDERTRLGTLGNAYANKLEARMNKAGLTSEYDRGTLNTRFDGYSVDFEKVPGDSELSKFKGLDVNNPDVQSRIQSELSTKFSVPPENIKFTEGKLTISAEGLGYFESKGLIKASLEEAGYSKIGSAIRSRIMGRRAGIDWHPIKKLDKKILDSLDAKLLEWKENRAKAIENGIEQNPRPAGGDATEEVDTNKDGVPDTEVNHTDPTTGESTTASSAANAADEAVPPTSAATTTAEAEGSIKALRESKVFSKGAGLAAVIGIACLVNGIAKNIDSLKQTNVILPLMRIGTEAMSVGNQIITSDAQIEPKELGVLAKSFYDPETQTSWKSAKSVQAELNKELTGPDILSEAKIDNSENVVTQFLSAVPGLDTVCEIAGSTIGSVFTFGIGLISGPIGAVAGEGFSRLVAPDLINGLVRWIGGHPISLEVAGANYGNYINYGAKLAAKDSFVASGARKLTDGESLALKQYQIQDQKEELQSRSFASRIFDPTDVTSLVGNFMSEQAPDPVQNIARVASILPKTAASIFKIPSFIMPKVKAEQGPYKYSGISEYGYSVAELRSDAMKDPFANADIVADMLDSPAGSGYIERANACFGMKIAKDSTGKWAVTSTGKIPTDAELNNSDNNCNDTSNEWLRIRAFVLNNQLMESYGCYEDGDNGTCSEFGLDNGSTQTTNTGASAQYIPDCSVNGGNAAISCTAIDHLLGIPYSRPQRAAATDPNPAYLDCSAFTGMALYRTFGVNLNGLASVGYRSNTNFVDIPDLHTIQPGDFIGKGTVATGAGGTGHIALVVSYDPTTKKLITVETDGSTHPSRVVTTKGLAIDGTGTYSWAVRYVGTKTPVSTTQ